MVETQVTPLLHWSLTPWQMNGRGGWKQQPVIVVEGCIPFFAEHPQEYINKLQELHDDLALERGRFYSLIGELKDALESAWNVYQDGDLT